MTTRAEEIAAEGPYRVVDAVYVEGPTGRHGRYWNERDAESHAKQFNAAYKQGQQDRWIPVSERLPEERLKVLCYDNFYRRIGMGARWDNQSLVLDESDDCEVTHWMPLPPNPEQP